MQMLNVEIRPNDPTSRWDRVRRIPPVFAVLFFSTWLLIGCNGPPAYRTFMSRSQEYYATLATCCESLIAQLAANGSTERLLPGSSQALPDPIRDLQPESVLVKTNGVLIRVRDSRGSYGITWYRNEMYDGNLWQLETFVEGERRVVYSISPPARPR